MAKEYVKKFYKSTSWEKCRESYSATTLGGICEQCKEVPGSIVDYIVEMTPESIDNPDIKLHHENL
ncbi:hypothetical protein [Bacillus thuringiensis]|uniref:hypothetical protein n=1 Tax=Bacillus thuringiensis TaxID=1428 RepID=UPI00211D6A2E|nr:hypothetical protein [Bacillus thuringiensis]